MRRYLLASSFVSALLFNACVTIPNTTACSVAGKVDAGMNCAETQTDRSFELNLAETIDFLEAQEVRPDPKHPGQELPAHGAAVCQSSSDWNKQKTALEQACRELGKRCSYQMKSALKKMAAVQ